MSTPMDERELSFPAFEPNHPHQRQSSDEDDTIFDEQENEEPQPQPLRLNTFNSYATDDDNDHLRVPRDHSARSPAQAREQSQRLEDELEMLRAERVVSNAERDDMSRSKSVGQSRSRTAVEPEDDFDIGTTPLHEKTKIYKPPTAPATKIAKFFKKVHESSWLVRYIFYITPVTLVLLIPLMLGALVFNGERLGQGSVGGVELLWFSIWLEIVWLTLWAGRILAKMIPYPFGLVSSIFTNNSKKWRDLGKALELPATLFFWWLAVEVSFLPTMKHHHVDGHEDTKGWELTANKVFISVFVGATLNFIEKIIIQLIAISFHLRTYADRIELNKFQITSLVKLYIYSKEKIAMDDSEFEVKDSGPASGVRTPMVHVKRAQKGARNALAKVGDVAGKVAGDFTGRNITGSTHPHQVILQLLNSTSQSQVLARRLYRTFVHENSDTVLSDDLRPAFDNDDEADAAFTMFDKDLNGDISMEELEAVCVEIGRERKAITASLKDLDSVVSKLDDVFMFIVLIISILVLISLISTSAYGVLTSLGSTVLALSWLFSATAQEFLQSCIFVFVKHPFDVGDRVKIYGNQAVTGVGEDYFVKEIALFYTEFKKMEGHIVQAPNSYLNTLFIQNQRRSGGLAEAVPITIKFGTTLQQIEALRERLLDFVGSENREYQNNILTELTTVTEAFSITLNVVFFYKSNWQNELLRLQRRNKFICALMISMQDIGIEGPRHLLAGQKPENPVYLNNAYPSPYSQGTNERDDRSPGPGPRSGSLARDAPFVPAADDTSSAQPLQNNHPSILRQRGSSSRMRGESIGQMSKRVDFSLGMSSAIQGGADFGDVFDKPKFVVPTVTTTKPSSGRRSNDSNENNDDSLLRKTTSRDSGARGSIETSSSRRNRFFGRHLRSRLNTVDDGAELDDLEAGFSASDMPDIPEASGGESAEVKGRPRRGTDSDARDRFGLGKGVGGYEGRIDPRSGKISTTAVVPDGEGSEGGGGKMKRAATGW